MSRPSPAEPVLVVDDEAEIRSSVRAALALEGITNIVECADGDRRMTGSASSPSSP